jgi:uncharacterized membrane protein YagU involved in acid resistance
MNIYWAGLLAGFLATLPMTVFMMLLFRRLPRKEQYPLPPRQIAMELAEKAGVKPRLEETERTGLTLLAHFAYGTVMGALYSLFVGKVPGPALLKGMAFGLVVWAGSYLVLLPALGILRSATHHPLRRNVLMISAHIIWGAVLGWTVQALTKSTTHFWN